MTCNLKKFGLKPVFRAKNGLAQISSFSKLQVVYNQQSYFLGREIWARQHGALQSPHPDQEARKLICGGINACVEGCLAAEATRVLVGDA